MTLGVAGAVRPRRLKCCGIVGAGLMGGGIAMACAEAGMKAGFRPVHKVSTLW